MRKRRLMPQQVTMLAFMRAHRHTALFCQMRTGKTSPTIRLLQEKRLHSPARSRILIVAPTSALGGWQRELDIEGETDVTLLQGNRDKRLAVLQTDAAWTLTNPETWMVTPEVAGRERCGKCRGLGWCKTVAERTKCATCGGVGNVQLDTPLVHWLGIVLDESTTIKNPRASVTQFFLANFRDVPHRVILTGMPCPEGELDLWCQMAFLHGDAFGAKSYWAFRARMFEQVGYDWEPAAGTAEIIEKELTQRTVRISRKQARMPENKVRETRVLEFPPKMRKAYDTAERDYVLEHDDETVKTTMFSTTRWTWMRRLCGGFLDEEDGPRLVWDGKVRELTSLLRGELAREQVVVWFAFNAEITVCADALPDARVMHGDVPPKRRREDEAAFRRGAFRVFLLQQMVADRGMDLSAADTAIVYSRHPGLEVNVQTADRIVHPKKGTTPLLYVDLVVKDTVDEDVAELVGRKGVRAQRVLDGGVWERVRERVG